MAAVVSNAWLDAFHRIGAKEGKEYGDPPAKKLSRLLRPAFIAEQDKTLVWGDWSNIEARCLPWLAASDAAEEKLDIFRAVDKDPTMPDVYIRTAGDLLGLDAFELWADYKNQKAKMHDYANSVRQSHGKVPELSLGFGGGLGALMAMAATYGVYVDEKTARDMVQRWRDANMWAKMFWGGHGREGSFGIWGAVNTAIENPNTICPAGRVAYVYDPDYMKGTLFCALPCGRLLSYPAIKWEWREVENKTTKKIEDRYQLTYLKGYGRTHSWYGKKAENITQAAAASVLRRTKKRLHRYPGLMDWAPMVMHTHDEVVQEVDDHRVEEAARILHGEMTRNDDWDEGLPLAAEISTSWFYTKQAKEMEL